MSIVQTSHQGYMRPQCPFIIVPSISYQSPPHISIHRQGSCFLKMFSRKHNHVPSLLSLTCAVLSMIHPSAGAPGPQPTPPGEGLYPRQYNLPIQSGTNYSLVPPGTGTGAAYPPLISLATSTTPSAAPAMPTDIGCMAV